VPRHLFLPHLPLEEGYLGDGPDTRGSAVRRKTLTVRPIRAACSTCGSRMCRLLGHRRRAPC
jgi:hypothetical protein